MKTKKCMFCVVVVFLAGIMNIHAIDENSLQIPSSVEYDSLKVEGKILKRVVNQPYPNADEIRRNFGRNSLQVTDLNDEITPTDMVISLLSDTLGVEFSNVTYTGANVAGGLFEGGEEAGINTASGIMLSSGTLTNAIGPNDSGSTSTNNGQPGDPDLTDLIGGTTGTTNDAAILEFDFIPVSNTISFRFVMGSEEYPEYLNYSDVFGFFLDGENIAFIPGTTTPVAISTVNHETNSEYYVSNSGTEHDIQCDGFTTVFEATADVTPGNTHYIKLAVADFSDSAYDTWVFMEGGSFISGADLSGTTTDTSTSNPIENAGVILTGDNSTYQTNTNENGYYNFTNLIAGQYNIEVIANGYQTENTNVTMETGNYYTEDFALIPSGNNYIQLTNELLIYANNINENPPSYFTLNGEVNINNILYFDGEVTVDKRGNLYYPEISGTCGFYADDIQGEIKDIYSGGLQFKFYADESKLISKEMSYFCEIPIMVGGFPLTLAGMTINENGENIYLHVIPKLPFPLDTVIDHYSEGLVPTVINDVTFDIIYSHTNGTDYGGEISGLEWDNTIFKLSDVYIQFDTYEELFAGGFQLQIPGELLPETRSTNDYEEISKIPVKIKNANGEIIQETNFEDFLKMRDFLGSEFLNVGMDIEFISGAINSFIITIGSNIPIAQTGLFITEMTGGVEDLQTDNWKIIANIDIETGLEIPSLGSPVKLNDFGVEIHPMSYLKGSGDFLIFDNQVSDGYIEYDGSKKALVGEGNLDLYDMLVGQTNISLKGENFNGGGIVTVKTPSDLPWFLNWAENKVFGSADLQIHNLNIQNQIQYGPLSLAQKMEFGKQSIPWFHYYLGSNYGNLTQIWRGTRDGRQVLEFLVSENTSQIFIVAGNELNLFDFIVENSSDQIFNSSNTFYEQFSETLQTIMVIENPESGLWEFSTEQTGDITLETKELNQQPTTLVSEPQTNRNRSNQITLDFTDYSDTLNVKVFYDTDRKKYDGVFIQEFDLVNNATVDFTWQNDDLQNGEYFIYTGIDDGYNAPIMQYAPGSIIVENDTNIEIPQNLSCIQINDSIRVQWYEPIQENTFATTVYFKNISDNFTDELSISDTNLVYLQDLDFGQEYEIWASFINDNGTISPKSNIENIVFTSNSRNNPPYFTMNPDSIWTFVVGENADYELSANDADGNGLTFSNPESETGMSISGTTFSWSPTEEQKGVYNQLITVTDGSDIDSLYQEIVVYTQEQMEIDIAFSSLNLYEADNMFVKIQNFRCPDYNQQVTIENLTTSQQATLSCRKVNDFDYIGQFELSVNTRTDIVVSDGDTIQVNYNYDGDEYIKSAYYISTAQPSDIVPPANISDLQTDMIGMNELKLSWTATGDDGSSGQALKYDIRYAFEEIAIEDDYFVANQIEEYPNPSIAGETDSLIINLNEISNIYSYDEIFFSIKVEDEMQNRSGIGNCASSSFLIAPATLTAEISDVYKVDLNWTDISNRGSEFIKTLNKNQRETIIFENYRILRKLNNDVFEIIADNIITTNHTDTLFSNPDGNYTYGVQAIYNVGESDTLSSNVIEMDRFIDVRILCALQDTTIYDSVNFVMAGLDTIYTQIYNRTTNQTGLVLMDSVFKSNYGLEISKFNYITISDTITISESNNEFVFTLGKAELNLQISINESQVELSWSEMDGATSYKVFSSNNPETGFIEDSSGNFNGTSWSTSIINEMKFYFVKAIKEETQRNVD